MPVLRAGGADVRLIDADALRDELTRYVFMARDSAAARRTVATHLGRRDVVISVYREESR